MWPFDKPEEVSVMTEQEPPIKVGERFKYLGVDMICCSNAYFDGFSCQEAVIANYLDVSGRIQEITFNPRNWPALKAENNFKE